MTQSYRHLSQRAAKGVSDTLGHVFATFQKLIQPAGGKKAVSEKNGEATGEKTQPLCLLFGSTFLAQNVREYFNESKKRTSQRVRGGLWPNH